MWNDGSIIVLRGLSLMGDAMSHAVLPGVALSFLFNIPMFIGALVTGMFASLFIGFITQTVNKTRCCNRNKFHCIPSIWRHNY